MNWSLVLASVVFLVLGNAENGNAMETPTPVEMVDIDLVADPGYALPSEGTAGGTDGSLEVLSDFDMIGLLWDEGVVEHVWLQVRDVGGKWGQWFEIPFDSDEDADGTSGRAGSAPVYTGASTGARFAVSGSPIGVGAMVINTQVIPDADSAPLSTVNGAFGEPTPSWAGPSFVHDRVEWDTSGCRREGAETSFSSASAIVIHHTAASNTYTPAQVPGIIAGHCLFHVDGRGWDDIGYNFLVDRFGEVWEGRTGSKTSPVQGAHTAGFNSQTQGVALMGNLDLAPLSPAGLAGLREMLDWLTGWHSIDPTGFVTLKAATGAVGFDAGEIFVSSTIVGHRDLGLTSCPGDFFYATLATLRTQIDPFTFGFDPSALRCDGKPITIFGTPGNDVIYGTDASDVIHGIFGHDWIIGLEGDDQMCGDSGNDVLIGGGGFDRLFGGIGLDSCGGEFRDGCELIPNDEQFFYRSSDGVFKYYELNVDGSLGAPAVAGIYSTGWSSIGAVDLDGDSVDEQFFYRSSDGVFKYYRVGSSGSLVAMLNSGIYSLGWSSITSVDLDGDGEDEQLFYRASDGVFKYYGVAPDGTLEELLNSGVYSTGWSSLSAVDLDGDGEDEQLFYRASDGVFKYYGVRPDGSLEELLNSGVYSTGWSSLSAVDLDGDGQDEQLFYRASDGAFKYYDLISNGSIGAPVNSGVYSTGWSSLSAIDLD